jgi:hypothetical protein
MVGKGSIMGRRGNGWLGKYDGGNQIGQQKEGTAMFSLCLSQNQQHAKWVAQNLNSKLCWSLTR